MSLELPSWKPRPGPACGCRRPLRTASPSTATVPTTPRPCSRAARALPLFSCWFRHSGSTRRL